MKNLEIWKDIIDYENLYQVSSHGRVKSLKFGKERIMKTKKDGRGYLFVTLSKEGERKDFKVHRLVAKAFIENHLNLREINHRDENKENNAVENLEWCDRKYNINYGTRNQRSAKAQSKKVIQYSIDGRLLKEWVSTMDVQRQLGFSNSNIGKCCKGKYKQAYGFIWKYAE